MAGVYVKKTVKKKKTTTFTKKTKSPSAGYQKCRNCGGDGVVRVRKSK